MTNNSINSNKIMNQQNQNDQHPQQEHDYNNYNSAHGPRSVPAEALELIRQAYVANVCPFMTQQAAIEIEQAMNGGMDVDTILLAIQETGYAPRPSLYYLRAILRNWAESGVTFCRASTSVIQTNDARPWWR